MRNGEELASAIQAATWRGGLLLLALVAELAVPTWAGAGTVLYGSSVGGEVFTVNVVTGAGTFVGRLAYETTEIECDPASTSNSPPCFAQLPDGAFLVQRFDINNGQPLSGLVDDGHSFTGLEYVGGILYGTTIDMQSGPSSLRTLDPTTGASGLIGPTGVGPISGLAFDTTANAMYGIAGGPGLANLYTIDLATGLATLVGNTGIHAGSLQFGPDGNLYAGTTGPNGGDLYRIDPATAMSTLVGPTGFDTVTGLTLVTRVVRPAPALATWGLTLLVLALPLVAARRLRSARSRS